MCLAQGPQRSDASEARTRGPSASSQALYHSLSHYHCLYFPQTNYFQTEHFSDARHKTYTSHIPAFVYLSCFHSLQSGHFHVIIFRQVNINHVYLFRGYCHLGKLSIPLFHTILFANFW